MLKITNKKIRYTVYILLTLSILACTLRVINRLQFEHKNKTVDIAISYREFDKLSLVSGIEKSMLLSQLIKQAKITSIALEEETLENMANSGRVTFIKGSDILNMQRIGASYASITNRLKEKVKPEFSYVITDEQGLLDQIHNYLKAELGTKNVQMAGTNILEISDDYEELKTLGLGIYPQMSKELSGYPISIIPRLKNNNRINKSAIELKFNNLESLQNINTIIFEGDTILGYPEKIPTVKEKLEDLNLNFGYIEFAEQLGAQQLANKLPRSVVRVHSISELEMPSTPKETAIMRYVRAVKERNVRIIFLHPYFTYLNSTNQKKMASEDIGAYNIDYFNKIYTELTKNGFTVNANKGSAVKNHRSTFIIEIILMSMGAFIIFLLFCRYFFKVNTLFIASSLVILCLGFLTSIIFQKLNSYNQFLALCCTVIFPTYAIISQISSLQNNKTSEINFAFYPVIRFLLKLLGLTLLGALFIVGFLSDIPYLLGINPFSGIKIAFLAPLFIIGYYFFMGNQRLRYPLYILKRILYTPMKTISFVSILLGMIVIFIYILRSGNYLSGDLPALETHLRSSLETLLLVRPRTKEFLIGYPFLIATFLYFQKINAKSWLWLFSMIGSIALISVTNSFCHAHTPLWISLYRTFLGLICGYLVGMALFFLVKLIYKMKELK